MQIMNLINAYEKDTTTIYTWRTRSSSSFWVREQFSVSEFIDEDTIIAGYGKMDYDFELPLPKTYIIQIFGTTSWKKYFDMQKDKFPMLVCRYPELLDKISIGDKTVNQIAEEYKQKSN